MVFCANCWLPSWLYCANRLNCSWAVWSRSALFVISTLLFECISVWQKQFVQNFTIFIVFISGIPISVYWYFLQKLVVWLHYRNFPISLMRRSELSLPTVPLVKVHLWDCPKWSWIPLLTVLKGCFDLQILMSITQQGLFLTTSGSTQHFRWFISIRIVGYLSHVEVSAMNCSLNLAKYATIY